MQSIALPWLALLAVASSTLLSASDIEADDPPEREPDGKLVASLKYQTGKVTLGKDLATADLPPEFRFLGPQDAQVVLEKIWDNPPGSAPLGMILPADIEPDAPESWGIIVTYEEEGYVKDGDAGSLDYNQLLKEIREEIKEDNTERVRQGFEPMELVGWATKPHYDAKERKLYWAKELKFGDSPHNTLNYNLRILGRRGVLVLNAVADMSDLATIQTITPRVLDAIDFNAGHRYEDFNPSIDKVAAYGIGALIVGKVALKVGLLKGLWLGILGAKKLILLGCVAVTAFFAKLTGQKKKRA